jgi:hypothetical protein
MNLPRTTGGPCRTLDSYALVRRTGAVVQHVESDRYVFRYGQSLAGRLRPPIAPLSGCHRAGQGRSMRSYKLSVCRVGSAPQHPDGTIEVRLRGPQWSCRVNWRSGRPARLWSTPGSRIPAAATCTASTGRQPSGLDYAMLAAPTQGLLPIIMRHQGVVTTSRSCGHRPARPWHSRHGPDRTQPGFVISARRRHVVEHRN